MACGVSPHLCANLASVGVKNSEPKAAEIDHRLVPVLVEHPLPDSHPTSLWLSMFGGLLEHDSTDSIVGIGRDEEEAEPLYGHHSLREQVVRPARRWLGEVRVHHPASED